MAKKKTEKPEMPASAEPKIKPVRLDLDEREHRELRAVAGLSGKSMSAYARDAVLQVVRDDLKQRGITKL